MPDRTARVTLSPRELDAVLFDLDGVLTDTAPLHATTWKTLFDDLLRCRAAATGAPFRPFDSATDYLAHVDKRRREDGVRAFIASRGIALPEGDAADSAQAETVAALAARKQRLFEAALRHGSVEPAPGAAPLLQVLRRLRMPVAVVSASRNCAAVLAGAGLDGLVDLRVDGLKAAVLGLPGKPAPDTFLEAARRLGVPPARCAVFEDAIAGVEAGRRGDFGLVVGVDRGNQAEALRRHGADIVVRDLTQVAAARD